MSNIIERSREVNLAVRLIELGARLQVLKSEIKLPDNTLRKLSREINPSSRTRGQLPISDVWFLKWKPNIHASLFMAYYRFLSSTTNLSKLQLLIKAYELYIEEISRHRNYNEKKLVFTITRA